MPDRDRDYRSGLSRLARVVSAAGLACLAATEATAQWCVEVGIGGNTSRDVVVESRSNDRASICDEHINARALAVPGCATPDRGAGDGWRAPARSARGAARFATACSGTSWSHRSRVVQKGHGRTQGPVEALRGVRVRRVRGRPAAQPPAQPAPRRQRAGQRMVPHRRHRSVLGTVHHPLRGPLATRFHVTGPTPPP